MSLTRLGLRIFLVSLIVGLLGLGFYLSARSRPDYYYDRAQAAIEREDYAAARINLVNLVRHHPDHAEGFDLLSRVILREARKNGTPATYFANPAALASLERAAELRPVDDDLQRRLMAAYLQLRFFNKAAIVAETVYKSDRKNGDANFALAWRAVKGGRHEEAERLFAEAYGLQSRYVFHGSALKVMYYTDRNDVKKTAAALVEAAEVAAALSAEQLGLLAPRDREIMLQVLLVGQNQSAKPEVDLQLSKIIMSACEKLQAGNLLDSKLIAKYSAQSQVQLSEGLTGSPLTERQRALRQQLNDMAGEIGEKAVKSGKGPSSAVVYWTTARKHVAKGRYDDALKVLEDGLAAWETQANAEKSPEQLEGEELARTLSDDELQLHMLAGRLLIIEQRYQEAREHLEKLDGHEDYEGWGHLLQGDLLLRDGQLTEARDEFLRAQQTLESPLQVHMSLARVYLGLKDWQAAIPHLEEMLAPEESLSDDERAWRRPIIGFEDHVHLDLLRARLKIDDWEAAQENLQQLKETEAAPEAWRLAVVYLWEKKDAERAWKYIKLAREKFPEDIQLVFLEASFMQAEGRSASAETLFDEFVNASRNDPIRRLAQARWLIRDNKPDKALRVLNTLERYPDLSPKARNTALIFETQALIELEQYDEASANIETLTKEPATTAGGHLLQATIAWRTGNEALGKQSLQRAYQWDSRDPGREKVVMQVRTPQGEIVGVGVRDAYYW